MRPSSAPSPPGIWSAHGGTIAAGARSSFTSAFPYFWTALLLVGLWETDLSAIRLAVEVVSLWGWASALHLFANR